MCLLTFYPRLHKHLSVTASVSLTHTFSFVLQPWNRGDLSNSIIPIDQIRRLRSKVVHRPVQGHIGRELEAGVELRCLQTSSAVLIPPCYSAFVCFTPDMQGLLLFLPGLGPSRHSWAQEPGILPKLQGDKNFPWDTGRQQGSEGENLDLFLPVAFQHSFIIFWHPPERVGLGWRRDYNFNPLFPPHVCTGLKQKMDFCSTD